MPRVVCCLLLWVGLASVPRPAAAEAAVYVSVAGENRIARYAMDPETGELTHRGDVATEGDPGPLAVDPTRRLLFASLRGPGRLSSFRIDPRTGGLTPLGTIAARPNPAYLAADRTGRFLLSAYYDGGKAAVHAIRHDGTLDEADARWYDTAEKAHAILTDPSNRFALVPHTGANVIFQFRFDAATGRLTPNDPPRLETGGQTGPRHLCFHPRLDVAYVDNEQGSSVTAYRFDRDAGTLTPVQTLSTLPAGFGGDNSCAELGLTPCGRFLYVSNRGHDSLAGFAVDPQSGELTALGQTPTERTPRSFHIEPGGRFLYAAGESSGKLAAYRIDDETGALERFATYEVGEQPWWVLAVERPEPATAWERIAPFFAPPAEFADDFGDYRSPLLFEDGSRVETAEDWQRRRQEILRKWHAIMGPWPPVVEEPEVEYLERQRREGVVQHTVRFEIAPGHRTSGYVLAPDSDDGDARDPVRRPAVLVVFYEPETAVGLKGENRDFALQLARRGFVTLSIGLGNSLYYPSRDEAQLQPLSALAWGAANAWHVLAARDDVDPERIGVTGHSYGGKWAMFASCLYEKFACAAWCDGGIVFDETRGNVNYWEPWYLGYEGPEFRKAGIPSEENPRTGAYKRLIEEGRDLHELHALMAPRPFLVSGGSEDPPSRWKALNHAVAVNRLLGCEDRVTMTNRPTHAPTPESNEQMYAFFEHFLKPPGTEGTRKTSAADPQSKQAAGWKAGVARADITPTKPMWLAGYGGRDRPAEGKLHDLWIKALALEDAEGSRVVLLTSDLCGIPKWMDDSVCAAVAAQHGLDRSQVRLTYSHNHCAPVVRGDLEDYYPLDAEQRRLVDQYSATLERQMVETIGEALGALRPASLSAGVGRCTFAVNRRNNREADVPGILARGEALNGPVDHTVPVLAVRDADGGLLSVMFAYACHNTTLSFYQWCGDYAGFGQIAVEERHPGAAALFVAGCGGDQNPLPRRSVELCRKYGEQLAAAVEDVLDGPMRPLAPRLRTAFEFVTLDYERNPTRAELKQHAAGTNPIRVRWAKRFLKQLDAGTPPATSAAYAVQVWRLGDQDWISLGGEALVDYAHRFRAEHGERVWVTSYSADLIGYIPSRRNILEGLYEGTNLYEYMHPADKWALDTEERVAAAVGRLMDKVRRP